MLEWMIGAVLGPRVCGCRSSLWSRMEWTERPCGGRTATILVSPRNAARTTYARGQTEAPSGRSSPAPR